MRFFVPRRIIGLDIGTDAIKAVQVTTGFKGFKVTGFAKKKRDNKEFQDPVTALSQEIRMMLDEASLDGDIFVSSISCNSVAVRNIRLPFSSLNKVRRVIEYEVESVLPFPLGDILVDFFVVGKKPTDGTDLLVVVAPKEAVKEHLEIMKRAGIEPEIVDLDSSSPFYCWEALGGVKKEGSIAIIDLGSKKTSVSIIKNGVLQFMRSIPIGGEAITAAVARSLSLNLETAEEQKRKEGIILLEHPDGEHETMEGDGGGSEISGAIVDVLNRLKRDVDLAFSFYQTLYTEEKVSEILLTGGTSNIRNIDRYFEREFDIKTSVFSPLEYLGSSVGDIGGDEESIIAGALGLALRGTKRGDTRINFRKEEYSLERKHADTGKNLMFILIGLVLAFSLYVGNLFTNLHLKERRYAGLKAEIRQIFTQTFPDVRNIVNEVQQMKNKIDEERNKKIPLGGLPGGVSFLDILREVSIRMPAGEGVKVRRMTMNDENVSIVGEASSFDTIDKITSSLKQSKLLREVTIKDAKMSTRQGVVSFDIRIRIVD
ncbi:MAG: type IV pilus assembly protein PilM [Pseudomonadota bacterium]